jgi:hypothetical protein
MLVSERRAATFNGRTASDSASAIAAGAGFAWSQQEITERQLRLQPLVELGADRGLCQCLAAG